MKITHILKKSGRGIAWVLLVIGLHVSGCKKMVEIEAPVTTLNSANVYQSDATATAVLTGIYSTLNNVLSPVVYTGLSSDEFTLYSGVTNTSYNWYYTNTLTSINNTFDFWTGGGYNTIFTANSALEGLTSSTKLSPAVKQQLTGEAKFIRAYCYFYLVNLYGDVPLALSSDYKANAILPRSPKEQVWKQIISDLTDAQSLLSENYLNGNLNGNSSERERPTKWAATALLARAYLYFGNLTGDVSNYKNAEIQASSLIGNSLFNLSTLNNAFLKYSLGNKEAIWQIQPTAVNFNADGEVFIIPSTGPDVYTHFVYLNPRQLGAFEPGDQRKLNWVSSIDAGGVTYYFPFKYKANAQNSGGTVTEYEMVFRLGEQYLIRAEARAQQGEANATDDLNAIRNRAGLLNYTGPVDKASLLTAIVHERQVELFTEGHRWLDLKRTGTVDAVMGAGGACADKGGNWRSEWQYYPIPQSELNADPNLKQNPGY